MCPTPSYEKENDFTRLSREVAAANRGAPIGRGVNSFRRVISADTPTGVSTPAMREIASDDIPPLAPSLPADEQARRDALINTVTERVNRPVANPVSYAYKRALPDFTKVEGIHLQRNVVIVDGLEMPIPDEDVIHIKKWCVELAVDVITREVAKAVVAFAGETIIEQGTQAGVGPNTQQTTETREGTGTETPIAIQGSEGLVNNSERSEE